MNVLYLSYWSIEDGLTQSTIFPQLPILENNTTISSIVLVTIERNNHKARYCGPELSKLTFLPLYSKGLRPYILNKILDFVLFPIHLRKLCKEYAIDIILARGAPTGALAWKVHKKVGIPFIVESFEPHADYMKDSGVWKESSLRYIWQKRWEEKQKRDALYLITVSTNYRNKLLEEGVDKAKLFTIPCTVDVNSFTYKNQARVALREQYAIPEEAIVGVYVGKFGDIYYDDEAFDILKKAFDYFGTKFFMIILTPNDKARVLFKIENFGMNTKGFFVDRVPHTEVPTYLSAADFAFSFVRPAESRKFCSPIKHGEYWANGLPIIMGEGIGDDSEIIAENPALGFVIDNAFKLTDKAFKHIDYLISSGNRNELRNTINKFAASTRGVELNKSVLNHLFNPDKVERK